MAEVAALLGDPGRANMLEALMDGRALTASELAAAAGVAPSTASGHLAKLVEARLLAPAAQGRHRYFRLASPEVARMLEAVMVVAGGAAVAPRRRATPSIAPALREARTCYDHLAGRLGVALADALAQRGAVVLTPDGGEVTPAGRAFLEGLGVDVAAHKGTRRALCRPCLDWSERRSHIAGALGAALLERTLELGWIRRAPDGRAVTVTPHGRLALGERFGIRW